jgi:uncharacterized protein YbjT (DUF2867 family)
MRIGISGASGHLGTATIQHLKPRLRQGDSIVGISRTPERLAALGVEARHGDVERLSGRRPRSLAEVMAASLL